MGVGADRERSGDGGSGEAPAMHHCIMPPSFQLGLLRKLNPDVFPLEVWGPGTHPPRSSWGNKSHLMEYYEKSIEIIYISLLVSCLG